MFKREFREQMGILGQQENAFLADRIFEVFDVDQDGMLDFDDYTKIMDVLCNGDENQKNMFSFALMDQGRNGFINFKEFQSYFNKVMNHWSSLINTHVKLEPTKLKAIFAEIDANHDGVIDFVEY